jgi:hypothetical protein
VLGRSAGMVALGSATAASGSVDIALPPASAGTTGTGPGAAESGCPSSPGLNRTSVQYPSREVTSSADASGALAIARHTPPLSGANPHGPTPSTHTDHAASVSALK